MSLLVIKLSSSMKKATEPFLQIFMWKFNRAELVDFSAEEFCLPTTVGYRITFTPPEEFPMNYMEHNGFQESFNQYIHSFKFVYRKKSLVLFHLRSSGTGK